MLDIDDSLLDIFKIHPSSEKEKERLRSGLASCAEKEYADFLRGVFPSSSMSLFMAYRLKLLVENVFEGLIPSEDQVAGLFHITIERARSVTRTMLANYAEDLEKSKKKTFIAILTQDDIGEPTDQGSYIVTIRSGAIVGMMNQVLGLRFPGTARIRPRTGIAGQYLVDVYSRDSLLEYAEGIRNGGEYA